MCSSIQLQFFASQKTPASEGGRYKVCTFRSEGAARKNRSGDKSRREPKTHTKIRLVGHPGQERRKPQRHKAAATKPAQTRFISRKSRNDAEKSALLVLWFGRGFNQRIVRAANHFVQRSAGRHHR